MSTTFDQSKDEVAKLCQYFTINRHSFLASGVKEAHVRQSLIDPFFEALGWDMRNASMAAPQYREVITEDSLDVEGQQKAPDYTFRLGTLAKFYVEAKKCGININADPASAYQLRRYGFSAKLALSILTDFEELGVYDCASRPHPSDKASHARIQYLGFSEYPDRWREIWDVFSREAVWSGTFDQFVASKRKRGTSEVDSEFLKDIEGWRDVLARNLAIRNGDLSADDLNAVVQRIIDRIIFLRMAEDRGLESYGQLHKLCEQPDIYCRFMDKLCQKADQKYNSGLFHFQKEPGVADTPDTLTPRLAVDDNVLKPILQSLYFEHGCPYHFGVLPVEILGTVYERFLGKVIRLTAGHQAKVEEKPEVRKAGGVYYTPAYIVNYIVLNTVGKQIEDKSPVDLAGSKTKPPFRVLDMACGSGSFLLGAYQFLLDHCLKWYQANPSKKHASAVYQNAKGETRLTIAERKRILTTHIFGVDIDRQAVETTKLSLLLKALEGENDSSLSQQMSLFHERALPNLSDNIKCGNSLISSDFSMIPEDLVRVHVFDWPAQFPDAMKAGGFDAIIGNPPYGRLLDETGERYVMEQYKTFSGTHDVYVAFIERAIHVTKTSGRVSFIVPSAWLGGPAYKQLRLRMLEFRIEEIISLPFDVFADAYIDTATFVLEKKQHADQHSIRCFTYPKKAKLDAIVIGDKDFDLVPVSVWEESPDKKFVLSVGVANLVARLFRKIPTKINDYAEMKRGVLFDKDLLTTAKTNKNSHPYFEGDVYRYDLRFAAPNWVEYGPKMREWPKEFRWFEGRRLLMRRLVNRQRRLMSTVAEETFITNKNLYSLLVRNGNRYGEHGTYFLLGILNSRLLSVLYLSQVQQATKDDFPQVTITDVLHLPCPMPNANMLKRISELSQKALTLVPKLRAVRTDAERATLQNAVTTTDAEIDRLVYELYGLTEKEIKIVEGAC